MINCCQHPSCDQPSYNQSCLCYYHCKLAAGLLSTEDRKFYLKNNHEVQFVEKLDKEDVPSKVREELLAHPFSVEVIKLTTYILQEKYGVPPTDSISDVSMLIIMENNFPPEDLNEINWKDYVKQYCTKFVPMIRNDCSRKKKSFQDFILPECKTPEECMIEHERNNAFWLAQNNMTEKQKKVIAYVMDGKTEVEIADLLGITQQAVNKHKRKAFKQIQKEMQYDY